LIKGYEAHNKVAEELQKIYIAAYPPPPKSWSPSSRRVPSALRATRRWRLEAAPHRATDRRVSAIRWRPLARAREGQRDCYTASLSILQSSTATGLMAASFAAGGLVDLVPALAVMLGANVGTPKRR